MVSAPILIDGTRYLCSITTKKNAQNVMIPYALVLKDANMNIIEGEKMADPSNVPDSSNPNAALGQSDLNKATTSHESLPSFQNANLRQNNDVTKEYNQENIKTENKIMKKNRIRITENQLHRVIKESVKQVLSELDWKTYANAGKKAHEQGRDAHMFDRAAENALDRQYGGSHYVETEGPIQRFHNTSNLYDYAHRPLNGYEDDWTPVESLNPDNVKNHAGGQEIANFVKGKNKYVNVWNKKREPTIFTVSFLPLPILTAQPI